MKSLNKKSLEVRKAKYGYDERGKSKLFSKMGKRRWIGHVNKYPSKLRVVLK